MEEQRVYLFVETPFSIKKQKGFLLLPMLGSLVVYVGMLAVFWIKMPEIARQITLPFVCAFLLSAVATAAFRLSYVTLEQERLVCRYCGFLPRRIGWSNRLRWKVMGGQLRVLAGSAVMLKMPDSDAARGLMAAARIPADQ